MNVLRSLSLRWKLTLASVLVQLIMLAALVWNGNRLFQETLAEQAELRIQEVTVLLNASLAPLMAGQDFGAIADVFRESRRRDGIQYFILMDRRGRVLLTDGWDTGAPPPPASAAAAAGALEQRLDARIPVVLSEQVYGELAFGISTNFIREARQNLIRQSLFIAVAALVLAVAVLTFVALWLTRHLRHLEQASTAVAQGRQDVVLAVNTDDEVGRMARAFNQMARRIEEQMEALRSSEERFRSLLTLSTDWYWEQDAAFRFTRHQSGAEGGMMPNVSRPVIGHCRWELDTTLGAADWARHRAVLESHQTFKDLEYGVRMRDGTIRYVAVHGEPMFTADGRFAGYRGTSSDITERKKYEASLRLAASVFATAREGIIITDSDWRIVDCNPTAGDLTGHPSKALLGQNFLDQIAPSYRQDFTTSARPALERSGYWRGECLGQRRSGEDYPLLLAASVVRDEGQAVTNYIFLFSDITALKEHQQKLEHLAHYDALTRLPNRILLADRLQLLLAQAKRSDEVLAVAYLDLDGFKPVNDTYGHDAGDTLLVQVAERLRACLRGSDTAARLGGDEFVLLIKADDFGDCEAVLLRVLTSIAEPYAVAGVAVEISASIGVTLFPQDGDDPDTLMRHADQAMYVAKQGGRNRYHMFDSERDRQVRAHREQLSRLQAALTAGEFELHYQPKVDMRRGQPIGAEALIRWRHPERGLLPPGEFLPLVEESDFAVPLGEWVIRTALAQMQSWHGAGIHLPVSVNVSARQLQASDFVDRLAALLAAFPDLPPAWLEIEIVETTALEDIQYVGQVISRCVDLGVSFALDDFGTGYSSLTYFKRLPASHLKIDQSFVRDMLVDPEDLAIVEGVVGLARAFQRQVIAEGVETAEHGARLLAMGCDLAQGYGISRPLPAEQIPAWVRAYRPPLLWQS